MEVFLNGRFVPETEAHISVFDRGFLYGDGLFETIRVSNANPFRWQPHLDRLERGLTFLRLKCPFPRETLTAFARELITRNGLHECLLRIAVSRGPGPRGYSPRGADKPTVVISLHPLPAHDPTPKRLVTAKTVQVATADQLTQFKTSNKLLHILARIEAEEANADEALLLDAAGHVVEAASGNLFSVRSGHLYTTPLGHGALPGITRAVVLELARTLTSTRGHPVDKTTTITPRELTRTDGVFMTHSSAGIVECGWLDGAELRRSPLCAELQQAYRQTLAAETTR